MFGRKVKVTLFKEDGKSVFKEYTDLDIRFSIRNTCDFLGDAKIDILNPRREVIDQFSSINAMYADSYKMRRLTLAVGWADAGEPVVIFDGAVVMAMPVSYPPDIWFSMRCMGFSYANTSIPVDGNQTHIRYSDNGLTFGIVVKRLTEVFKKIGLQVDNSVTNDDIIKKELTSGFTTMAKVRDTMRHLAQIDKNLRVYEEDKTIHIRDIRVPGTLVGEPITKDTGMIGLPRANYPNYYVETFLRTDIHLWNVVKVKSSFNFFYKREKEGTAGSLVDSGEFLVIGINHSGQVRDGKWTSTYDLLQINMTKENKNNVMIAKTSKEIKGGTANV